MHMFSTWGQSRHDRRGACAAMEREHRTLVRQHEALSSQGTVEARRARSG